MSGELVIVSPKEPPQPSARPAFLPGSSPSSSKDAALSSPAAGPLASKAVAQTSAGNSFLASLSRTAIFLVGMMLKRPARIFRPSKVSTFAFLRALATRDGRSFGPSGILGLLKDYGPWSLVLPLIPTLIINTTLTTLLFTTHSVLSSVLSYLPPFARPRPPPLDPPIASSDSTAPPADEPKTSFLHRNPHSTYHPTLLSALAGAGAGVTQAVLSTPATRLVAFLSRIITGSGKKAPLSATATKPPPVAPGVAKPLTAALSAAAKGAGAGRKPLAGSVKSRKDTLVWLKELRSAGVAGSSGWDGNWRSISRLGFEGWRWTVAKDGVGYALFFATFDSSRRLALHVREIIESSQPRAVVPRGERPMAFFGLDAEDEDDEERDEDGGLGRTGSKWGRLGQAGVLVLGGITAGTLFQLSSRPFDAILNLLQSPSHLRSTTASSHASRDYLLAHLRHPLHASKRSAASAKYRTTGSGMEPLPAFPLIVRTFRRRGLGYFFGPQGGEAKAVGGVWKRIAWRGIGVAPWGVGFLMFAWVGGEV